MACGVGVSGVLLSEAVAGYEGERWWLEAALTLSSDGE